MPKPWEVAGIAAYDFKIYVSTLIDERRNPLAEDPRKPDLISNFVRACDSESIGQGTDSTEDQRRPKSLTEQEIISNVFVYAFTGNDTTAITLTHSTVHLAARPEIQDWIFEEIQYYADSSEIIEWGFEIFFNLERCLAIMVSFKEMSICINCSKLTQICRWKH